MSSSTPNQIGDERIIQSMRDWVEAVVIGDNFCPFAKKVFDKERIRFRVLTETKLNAITHQLEEELEFLDLNPNTETTLLIFPEKLGDFLTFLDVIDWLLDKMSSWDYDGVYQLAHFHPQYQFAETSFDDPENFTNRAPYPTLHILRESSVEEAVSTHPNVDGIPERNIEYANKKGAEYFKEKLKLCGVNFIESQKH